MMDISILIYLFMARPMCAFDGAHTDARPGYPPSADTPGLFFVCTLCTIITACIIFVRLHP